MADVNCADILHPCIQTVVATGEQRLESQLLCLAAKFISLKLFIEKALGPSRQRFQNKRSVIEILVVFFSFFFIVVLDWYVCV